MSTESAYKKFMEECDIDTSSDHATDTPARVASYFKEFTKGLRDPDFTFTVFPKKPGHTYDQLIVQCNIQFFSMCAHHHLPFFGTAAVGYLPDEDIIGLSKLARVVLWKAKKPSIQEDLTEEIADVLFDKLTPKALFVYLRAKHLCMGCRGVGQPDAETITHCIRGELSLKLKDEFLGMIP